MGNISRKLNQAIALLNSEVITSMELNQAISLVTQATGEVEELESTSITWSVEDFEIRAQETEELAIQVNKRKYKNMYDRSKFQEALDTMIRKHDCNIGITWETIDYYLDTYCLIKEK